MDGVQRIMSVEKSTQNKDGFGSTDLKNRKLLLLKHEDLAASKQIQNNPSMSFKQGNGDNVRSDQIYRPRISNVVEQFSNFPRLEECSDKKRFAFNRSICLLPHKNDYYSRCSIKSFQSVEDINDHNSAKDLMKKNVPEMRQMYRRNSSRRTSHFLTSGIASSTNIFPRVSRFQSEGEVSLIYSLFN